VTTVVSTLEPVESRDDPVERIERRETPPASRSFAGRTIATVLFAFYLLSGLYIIPADQQAVVTRFGRVADRRVLPGIHYALPWPIGRVHKLKVLETRRAVIGGEAADQTLGRSQPFQMQFLTGDQNVVQMRIVAQYHIASPPDFLFHAQDVETLVRDAVEAQLTRETAGRGVDALLTTDKARVQQAAQSSAQTLLDSYGLGVNVSSVNIESADPPPEVADAFRDVSGARADAGRIVNEAQGYAHDVIPRARGNATQMHEAAEAYRARKINEAEGDAGRFRKLNDEYEKAREVTSQRMYVETMELVLPRIKKLILDRDVDLSILRRPE
jgi:membrane protease subunit HflK